MPSRLERLTRARRAKGLSLEPEAHWGDENPIQLALAGGRDPFRHQRVRNGVKRLCREQPVDRSGRVVAIEGQRTARGTKDLVILAWNASAKAEIHDSDIIANPSAPQKA